MTADDLKGSGPAHAARVLSAWLRRGTRFVKELGGVRALAFAVAPLAVAGFVVGALAYHSSHAAPGTTLAGTNVAGLTRDEVREIAREVASRDVQVSDANGKTASVSLDELGLTVDVEQSVDQVFARPASVAERAWALFNKSEVQAVVSPGGVVNSEALVARSIEVGSEPRNASVSLRGARFVAVPGRAGERIDAVELATLVADGLSVQREAPVVSLPVETVQPAITTAQAERAAAQANAWLDAEVALVVEGSEVEQTDPAVISSWVEFCLGNVCAPAGERIDVQSRGEFLPRLNTAAIERWVTGAVEGVETPATSGLVDVGDEGRVVATLTPGVAGTVVENKLQLAHDVARAVQRKGGEVAAVLVSVDPPVQEISMVPGDEPLPYAAGQGEKWINVDLTEQRLTAYEGQTPILRAPIVPGASATPTKLGSFKIWHKTPLQDLRGTESDGSAYLVRDVPWIMFFDGDYAIHGAYWRSDFGNVAEGDGSHGCPNVLPDVAKQLYDWAPLGTVVVTHY